MTPKRTGWRRKEQLLMSQDDRERRRIQQVMRARRQQRKIKQTTALRELERGQTQGRSSVSKLPSQQQPAELSLSNDNPNEPSSSTRVQGSSFTTINTRDAAEMRTVQELKDVLPVQGFNDQSQHCS